MLAADIELVDIDGAHWYNWYQLLVPGKLRHARMAVILTDNGVPIKAVVRGRGAVPVADITLAKLNKAELTRLAHALDVAAVVVVERSIIPVIYEAVEGSLQLGDDYVAQMLGVVRVLERYRGKGIWSEPPILELIPPLSYEPLQRTFDMLIADRTCLSAYVFEDDQSDVFASVVVRKRSGHIDLVTTHMGLREQLSGPDLARDWRKQHRQVSSLVSRRYDKVSLAVFLERATLERILVGPPDQLAREINLRNVILDPVPTWLLGLLGSATMAAVAGRGAKALARMLSPQTRKMATDLAHSAQAMMRESGAHPFALLGFDPIELWHQLRRLYQP